MKEPIISYVGLDIHKDSVSIAIAQAGRGAPQFIGTTVTNLGQHQVAKGQPPRSDNHPAPAARHVSYLAIHIVLFP